MPTSQFDLLLRGVSLRTTRPRAAASTAVTDHPHANADAIVGVVREDLGGVSHYEARAGDGDPRP